MEVNGGKWGLMEVNEGYNGGYKGGLWRLMEATREANGG